MAIFCYIYRTCSFVKEHQLAENLTSLPMRGVGVLLSVPAFNQKRVLMHAYSYSLPTNLLEY